MKPLIACIGSLTVLILLLIIFHWIGEYMDVPTLKVIGLMNGHTGRFGDDEFGHRMTMFGIFSSGLAFMITYFTCRIFMYYPDIANAIWPKKNARSFVWLLGFFILTTASPCIELTIRDRFNIAGGSPIISIVLQLFLVLLVWGCMRRLFLKWRR